jgi:ABC-type transport system involved in multi-copper enzyme maturation permease subunit
MGDLWVLLEKEVRELAGGPRHLRFFGLTVVVFGILPGLGTVYVRGPQTQEALALLTLLRVLYSLLALVVVVAQTAPDTVLRERVGRTMDWLLSTRLPDWAIFTGKVLLSAAIGYGSELLTLGIQLVVLNIRTGGPWSLYFFAFPQVQIVVFLGSLLLALYLAIVGTFVSLRISDQRTSYMVTVLSVLLLALPFLLKVVSFQFTTSWLWHAVGVLAAVDVLFGYLGIRFFQRPILVLTLSA